MVKKERTLKILAFSDYRVQDLRKIQNFSNKIKPDLILYGGDDVIRFSTSRLYKFSKISKHGFGGIIGNDDDSNQRRRLSNSGTRVFDLHRKPIELDDFWIIGLEGGLENDRGFVLNSETEIKKHLKKSVSKYNKKKIILVSHLPPFNILDRAIRFGINHIGSKSVRQFIDQNHPLLILCGHVHSQGGGLCKVGKSTIINLASHDSFGSIGRVCIIEISNQRKIHTKWYAITDNGVIDYSQIQVKEGENVNTTYTLGGLAQRYTELFEENNIRTPKDLLNCSQSKLEDLGFTPTKIKKMKLNTKAFIQNKIIFKDLVEIPKQKLTFIDIETDLSQSYIWMITILEQGEKNITKFFAKTPKEEKKILQKFLKFLENKKNPILCYYGGNMFDERLIKSRIEHYKLKNNLNVIWFDIKNSIYKSIVLPISDYGLKNTAKIFGYTFNFPEYDGMKIAMLYVKLNNKKSVKKLKNPHQLLKIIIDKYTDDDVKSLDYLIKKLMTDFKKKIILIDFCPKPLPLNFKNEKKILQKYIFDGYSYAETGNIFGKSAYYVKKICT